MKDAVRNIIFLLSERQVTQHERDASRSRGIAVIEQR